MAIFAELGIAEAVREAAYPVYISRFGRESGEIVLEMDVRDVGPFEGRNGHHRRIQGAVLAALRQMPHVDLRMGTRVTGLRREGNTWVVETSRSPLRAQVVVGADGRRSRVREALGIKAVEWACPGAALAVTVRLDRDPEPREDQLFGTHDSAFVFPLGDRQVRLYLLLHEDEDYARFKARPDGGLGYLKERLTAYFPDLAAAIAAIRDLREVQVIPSYYLLAERWVADGAALLGDAAHCVNPARGQGMNLAIADAWELAEVLAGALAAGRTDAGTLAAYEARRRRHVEYIQKEGDRTRRIFLATHPLLVWLRDRAFRNIPRTPRATRRLMAVLAGLEPPPSPAEDLLLLAAFTFPPVDRLVPAGVRTA